VKFNNRIVKSVHVWRQMRGSWIDFEWHNYSDVRYVSLMLSHPRRHAWWATRVMLYTDLGRKIPSYVYRVGMSKTQKQLNKKARAKAKASR
jgi:hypothetical protein